MTSSSSTAERSSGANVRTIDDSIMRELRSLTIALTEYLVHRKALEERRSTFCASLVVFIMSMGATAVITGSWIVHSHGGKVRGPAPNTYAGVITVHEFLGAGSVGRAVAVQGLNGSSKSPDFTARPGRGISILRCLRGCDASARELSQVDIQTTATCAYTQLL
jgi:hypothetical protein